MDPLSHVLSLLRPQAVGWRVFEATEAWTIRFLPKPNVVVFGQTILGDCDVVREDGLKFQVSCGDFILMASPPPWEMRALGGSPPMDFKALLANPTLLDPISVRDSQGAHGASRVVTRFIGGHFTFAAAGAALLGRLMPPIIHVRAADAAAGRLGPLFALLGEKHARAVRAGRR